MDSYKDLKDSTSTLLESLAFTVMNLILRLWVNYLITGLFLWRGTEIPYCERYLADRKRTAGGVGRSTTMVAGRCTWNQPECTVGLFPDQSFSDDGRRQEQWNSNTQRGLEEV